MAATSAIVAVAGTAYAANQQHEAQNSAQRAARRQVNDARMLRDQAPKAIDPNLVAQQKLKRAALGGQQSTILTGPSGLAGSGKTLLGQ